MIKKKSNRNRNRSRYSIKYIRNIGEEVYFRMRVGENLLPINKPIPMPSWLRNSRFSYPFEITSTRLIANKKKKKKVIFINNDLNIIKQIKNEYSAILSREYNNFELKYIHTDNMVKMIKMIDKYQPYILHFDGKLDKNGNMVLKCFEKKAKTSLLSFIRTIQSEICKIKLLIINNSCNEEIINNVLKIVDEVIILDNKLGKELYFLFIDKLYELLDTNTSLESIIIELANVAKAYNISKELMPKIYIKSNY